MIKRAIEKADVCYPPIGELHEEWRVSFFNVNRRSDLRKLVENSK